MEKSNVLFRADGSEKIGLGHIYRCIAIAERLQDNFKCYFALRNPSKGLTVKLEKFAEIIELKDNDNFTEEAEYISKELIPKFNIDIVTLDGYNFNTEYQNIYKKNCNSAIVSIDDDQPFHYASDAVINHAGGISENMISREPYTKLFLGHNYLMLRKDFLNVSESHKKITKINSILICFGGSDPENYTQKVVNYLKNSNYKITIIVGAFYTELETLKQSIIDKNNMEIMNNVDAHIIKKVMDSNDLAIVPSSTMGLEAFASNMILVTGITAENQRNIYNGLTKENTVFGINNFSELTKNKLLSEIDKAASKFKNYEFVSNTKLNDNILEMYKSLI